MFRNVSLTHDQQELLVTLVEAIQSAESDEWRTVEFVYTGQVDMLRHPALDNARADRKDIHALARKGLIRRSYLNRDQERISITELGYSYYRSIKGGTR